jgi:hypothetical protein
LLTMFTESRCRVVATLKYDDLMTTSSLTPPTLFLLRWYSVSGEICIGHADRDTLRRTWPRWRVQKGLGGQTLQQMVPNGRGTIFT